MTGPPIAIVIVTYNSAGSVGATMRALIPQLRDGDEITVVDNASDDATVSEVNLAAPATRILRMGDNVGFAAGCNAGAGDGAAPLLLFLNPDSRPEPGALDALRATAADRPEWGAWQALVILPDGTVNTSGGIVHYLGFAWAGHVGEDVQEQATAAEVGFASGAALMIRRDVWDLLGGFEESYFMYCEDVDLSLRVRLAGLGVGVVPAARVIHEYEFGKGRQKWFLLERNRWLTLLADYPGALLILIAPALAATEIALLAVASSGGWLGQKLRADAALVRALPGALQRRREVGSRTRISALRFASALEPRLTSPYLGWASRSSFIAAGSTLYWRGVLACLRLSRPSHVRSRRAAERTTMSGPYRNSAFLENLRGRKR